MFASLPKYRFHVPVPLAAPGAQYWRALTLTTHTAWYILSLRDGGEESPYQTFLLWWDTDMVEALKSFGADFESLLCVVPPSSSETKMWTTLQISEVWEGGSDEYPDDNGPLLVTADGQLLGGLLGRAAKGAQRRNLVARQVTQ